MHFLHSLDSLFDQYGYIVVFVGVLLESIGLPLPGESLMIGAAIYAATTHKMDIYVLVPVAAAGAIAGDQIGYFIGQWVGFRVLKRWGRKIGITDERLDLGRYLFRRYGGWVVFFGRFVAILRTFAAVLAGANRMPWHTFALWNALGGIAWTAGYGFAAYALGTAAQSLTGPVGIALGVVGVAVLVGVFLFVKRNESRLLAEAQKDMKQPASA